VGDVTSATVTVSATGAGSFTLSLNTSSGACGTTCEKQVTVSDTENPTITRCAADQQAEADSNCQAAVPDFTSSVDASDNCRAVTISQSPAAGASVSVGPHTITLTATDPSGHSAQCQATFTVLDTTPPAI